MKNQLRHLLVPLVLFAAMGLARADLSIDFLQSEVSQGKTAIRFSGSLTASGGRESGWALQDTSSIRFSEYTKGPTNGTLSVSSNSDFSGYLNTHELRMGLLSGSLLDIYNGPIDFSSNTQLNETYSNGGIGFQMSLFNNDASYQEGVFWIHSASQSETVSFSDVIVEIDFDFANLNQGAEVIWEESPSIVQTSQNSVAPQETNSAPQKITVSVMASKGNPNQEALDSANTTGVFMGNANASATNSLINTITGGLHNGRIVRARSHLINPRLIDTQSWVTADHALPNYLNFAANQGITMRQALGLEDVPVSSSVAGGSAPLMMGISIGHSKEPIDPKAPLESPERWEVYAVGDIGDVDQDALDVVNRGYRNRTYAGSIGAEYLVSDRLNVGTAFSYADSDTDFAENLGSADIEGQLGSVYATYFKDGAYVDALYSYGAFDHELIRNTGGGNAFGNTDSDAHTFSVNAGKNFVYNGLVTGPTVGIDHTTGTVDAYTETGALPLAFADRDFESTISSLGWQASKTRKVNSGLFTVQGSASWDHEYQPEDGVTRGTLVADPNVPFNGVGAGPGTDWLNLGLGLRLLTNSGIDLELDYQTQLFREDVTAHCGGLKVSTKF